MGKKVKVVFDTNVWISIFMEKRLRNEFMKVKQDLTVFVSEDIGLEVLKVLQYPQVAEVLRKIGLREKDVLRILDANSKKVEPKLKLHIINEDAEDNKILECALAAGADVIVSGDKHLLELGKFKKNKILTPRGSSTASLETSLISSKVSHFSYFKTKRKGELIVEAETFYCPTKFHLL